MEIKRKAPGIEKFISLVPEEKSFDSITKEISTTLNQFEESDEFKNDVSPNKPLTKIFRNFSKQFYPKEARKIQTHQCFRYLLLISEIDYFFVVLCLKLDFFNNPTLNIYQSLKKGKDFVHGEEEDYSPIKCFDYEFGYYFNPYELNFEVREAVNANLTDELKVFYEPIITKVKSLVN